MHTWTIRKQKTNFLWKTY